MPSEVVAVTEAVEFAVVEDRLRFKLTSGGVSRTYAISFHRARAAAAEAWRLVDAVERASASVHVLRKKRG
jgi:hypothetical protein